MLFYSRPQQWSTLAKTLSSRRQSTTFQYALCTAKTSLVLLVYIHIYILFYTLYYLFVEAIHRLENLIRENPVRFMTDPIIFNLWYVHVFLLRNGFELLLVATLDRLFNK